MNKEETAYSRMVDKVKAMGAEELETVQQAIHSNYSHPEDGYYAGDGVTFPFDYWTDLIYSEIGIRQKLKEHENLHRQMKDIGHSILADVKVDNE